MADSGEVTLARGWLERHPQGTLEEARQDGISEEAWKAAGGKIVKSSRWASPKLDAARAWVRAHPNGTADEAVAAGQTRDSYYRAKREIKEAALATARPDPNGSGTLEACLAWLRKHPHATNQEARAAGFTQATFYRARKAAGIPTNSQGSRAAMVPVRTELVRGRVERDEGGEQPLVQLIRRMEEELGVEELFYRRGVLEYVQRRQVRVHG